MKKETLFSMSLALLTLASCSSDEPEVVNPSQPTPIMFASSVAQTRTTNTALQKTQIASGVEVGLFVKNTSTSKYIKDGDNAKLKADGNGGFTGSALYFPGDTAISVKAYAPYNSAFTGKETEAVSFTVASDQSTDEGYLKSDLLYAAGASSYKKDNPTVALNFKHMLVKLNIKFTLGNNTEVNLKGATINIVNTKPTTKLKVSDGTIEAASGEATDVKVVTFAKDATTYEASAVIVPQTVAKGSFVQVVMTNGKALNAQLDEAVTLETGKSYTYNVKVAKDEIKFEGTTITDWVDYGTELKGKVTEEEAPVAKLYATFGTPGSNASYSAPTYTWTAGNSNLMTCFEFANGELAKYTTLKFNFSNLSEGASVRMGYYVGSEWTEFGNGYYSAGEKTVDLTALGIDLSTVTKISFGGKSGSGGSVDILASEVYLIEGAGDSTPSTPSGDGSSLTATFGTPGGNASYSAPTYTWTAGNNNLMTVFEFANGELKNYTKLTFTFSNLSSGASVRMGYYVGSTFTEFGSGYYSNGKKEVDLTALGIDLSTVTKIAFGGRNSSGSCDIKASDVILTK